MSISSVRALLDRFARSVYGPIWLGYVVLRIVAAAGVGIVRAPDTASWLDLDFAGSGVRLWVVPLFFKVLPADPLRVGGMVLLGILAWSALAAAVVSVVRHRVLRPIAFAAVLLLGLAGQVLAFDTVLLGESVAISVMVATVAAWIWFVRAPGWGSAAAVGVGMVAFAFSRHPNIVLTLGIAVVLALSLLLRDARRYRLALLGLLLVIVAVGWPMLDKNAFNREETLATVVSERILVNPARTEWFADHGMPISPAIRKLAGTYFTQGKGSTPIRDNARLWHWIETDARDTYLEYLLTHPGYTFGTPVRDSLDPDTAILSTSVAGYTNSRPVLPDPVQQLVWGDGPGELIFLATSAVVLVLVALLRRRPDHGVRGAGDDRPRRGCRRGAGVPRGGLGADPARAAGRRDLARRLAAAPAGGRRPPARRGGPRDRRAGRGGRGGAGMTARVVSVIGTRPQLVKAAVVTRALRDDGRFEEITIDTGQHYDPEMSSLLLADLTDVHESRNLDLHGGSVPDLLGRMISAIGDVLEAERPDAVLVYGDTNSTLAGALAASALDLPIAHVEAGLRSFNRVMREERNRVLVDHAADLLLCPTPVAVRNLAAEGRGRGCPPRRRRDVRRRDRRTQRGGGRAVGSARAPRGRAGRVRGGDRAPRRDDR